VTDPVLPATEPAAQRWRTRDLALGGTLLALVLAVSGVALGQGPQHEAGRAPADVVFRGDAFDKPVPDNTVAPAPAASLDVVLPQLKAFVSQTRGLPFTADVAVTLLPSAEFRTKLDESPEGEQDSEQEKHDAADSWLALRLSDSRADLEDDGDAFEDGVIGFYDSEEKALILRADAGLTPYVQRTLVHELTHALQDQHFDLVAEALDDLDDESAFIHQILVEGDANWVDQKWYDAQPRAVRAQVDREEEELFGDTEDDDEEPSPLELIGYYPYVAGPELVQQLRDAGGQARLDDAFTHLPTSTRQVTDLDAEDPVSVPKPAAQDPYGIVPTGGREVETGVMGSALLSVLIQDYPWMPEHADWWRGDRYVTTEVDGQICISVDLVVDTARHAKQLVEDLEDYGDYAAFTQGDAGVAIRSCVDGEDVDKGA
jgi:hypothetical protein